jgi:transcriptional regulator with XRE-family HTH domain
MMDSKDRGNAIKKLRGPRTQREMAAKACIDPSTWSAYEKGRPPRTQERLELITRALGCTLDRLDEVTWECRTERIRGEVEGRSVVEAQSPPPDLTSQEAADPLEHAIEARLTTIHQEWKEVLLLVADSRRSRP